MKILSFFNIKGGIGKTTLTTLVAYKLSSEGKKILIIDADLQANLTQNIYKSNHTDKTMVNAIEGATAEELIIKAPNPKYPGVDLIPSDIELCILAENMALVEDKNLLVAKWFKRNMNTLREYDYKAELDDFALSNGYSNESTFEEKFGKDKIVKAMLIQKAQDYVIDNANISYK